MKKYFLVFILAIVLSLAACGGSSSVSTYNNLSVEGDLYRAGEQTIKVTFLEESDHITTFKSSISKDDVKILFEDNTTAKTVKTVTYVSETEITVVAEGDFEASKLTNRVVNAKVEISNKALQNKNNGVGYIHIYEPVLTIGFVLYSNNAGVISASSTLELPYGSFLENPESYVELPDDNGTLAKIEIEEDGGLYIKVTGFVPTEEYKYPIVKIAASGTTFQKDLYIYIGLSAPTFDTGYPVL